MSGAVLALFGVAVAAAIGELLMPCEEGGTRRFLQFLTALVVLVLILQPFLSLLSSADGFFSGEVEQEEEDVRAAYEQTFSHAVANRSAEQLKRGLIQMLESEYGIAPEDCEVGVTLDEEGRPQQIRVLLSGKGLLQSPHEIAAGLKEKFNCDVEVR